MFTLHHHTERTLHTHHLNSYRLCGRSTTERTGKRAGGGAIVKRFLSRTQVCPYTRLARLAQLSRVGEYDKKSWYQRSAISSSCGLEQQQHLLTASIPTVWSNGSDVETFFLFSGQCDTFDRISPICNKFPPTYSIERRVNMEDAFFPAPKRWIALKDLGSY